jgi:hypothetical protein
LRSRFASSGRFPSREIVCVKRRCSGIRCSIRSRIGGSATGVLITDNCHDTVRRWGTMCTRNQRRARTKSLPEQKVNGKADGRRRPASDPAALTCAGAAFGHVSVSDGTSCAGRTRNLRLRATEASIALDGTPYPCCAFANVRTGSKRRKSGVTSAFLL